MNFLIHGTIEEIKISKYSAFKKQVVEILTQASFLIDLSGNLIETYKLLERLRKFGRGGM